MYLLIYEIECIIKQCLTVDFCENISFDENFFCIINTSCTIELLRTLFKFYNLVKIYLCKLHKLNLLAQCTQNKIILFLVVNTENFPQEKVYTLTTLQPLINSLNIAFDIVLLKMVLY